MAFHPPDKIAEVAVEKGAQKVHLPLVNVLLLGFLAGAYVAFGFLLDIRVTGNMPEEIWGSFSTFIGAAVFPVGLIFVLVAGGELLTGNMMADAAAVFAGKVKAGLLAKNWVIVCISNFVGSIFVAYFFGHVVGLTETGLFLDKTVGVAQAKLDDTFFQAFVSGIGANWLVCLAVWLAFAAQNVMGKILGIWFPIMAFVAIGFQHVVANMFVIPAAIFAGHFTWLEYLENFVAVFAGNAVGGAIFVAWFYYMAYIRNAE
ncbi:formate/nitrite transporter family protein [Sediminibacillus massiliensis]|uniref:formate/nitrite transporter family protein n=1 Tax=Sediminibacillus massiliensis TaxID=1926277 RepID=UPI0009886115|nr:formate/nitrite transporter family protein [Sediminibacillus massiliensis]